MEASMQPGDYWSSMVITWKGVVPGYAVWMFLITTMFLVDAVNY